MATIKSYTDLEQSRKLAEILPLESADMYYEPSTGYCTEPSEAKFGDIKYAHPRSIRCWSLAALLAVLPDELEDNHFLTLDKEDNEYCCCYEDVNGNSFRHTFADNPIDACVAMIEKLNELNLL